MWTVTSRWREIMRDNDDYIARNHVRVQRTRDVTVTRDGHGLYLHSTAHQRIDTLYKRLLHKSIARCRIVPIVRGLCSRPLRKYNGTGLCPCPAAATCATQQSRRRTLVRVLVSQTVVQYAGHASTSVLYNRYQCEASVAVSVAVSSLRCFGDRM